MTTLIEKLEGLPRFNIFKLGTSAAMVEKENGKYVNIDDLRAIIEQEKAEKQEPVCNKCKGSGEIGGNVCHGMNEYSYETINCPDCNGTGQPADIVAELVKALEWSLSCIHFDDDDPDMQEAVRCRDEAITLLTKAKEMMG